MNRERPFASSHRLLRLAKKLRNVRYRHAYVGAHVRRFLAQQIRALRGDMSQQEFGRLLGKPQSVVSRLEDPNYGKLTLQTLLEIATKLDRAVIVRIVDFPTFIRFTEDMGETAMKPAAYEDCALETMHLQDLQKSSLASLAGRSPNLGKRASANVDSDVGWRAFTFTTQDRPRATKGRSGGSALEAAQRTIHLTQATQARLH